MKLIESEAACFAHPSIFFSFFLFHGHLTLPMLCRSVINTRMDSVRWKAGTQVMKSRYERSEKRDLIAHERGVQIKEKA